MVDSRKLSLKMKKRMRIIGILLIIIGFVTVGVRLFYLQVIDGAELQKKAVSQQLRDISIAPGRGTIYDRNGNILAKSATVWTVTVSPKDVKDEKKEEAAGKLAELLGGDKDTILAKLKKNNYYEVIKRKVEYDEAEKIKAFCKENGYNFVSLIEDSKRYYPYGDFAAAVIGFTGVDNQGLSGLEAYYDDLLTGTSGLVVSAKNGWGQDMPFQYEKMYSAKDGYSLVTTLDETLQHFLEKQLSAALTEHNAKAVSGIVMNPKTGEVLAIASKNDFDPNDPYTITDPKLLASLEGLEGDEYKKALSNAQQYQWRIKIISDLYEPGSVFKVVTASAALEEKVVTLDENFYCGPEGITIADHTFHCWKAGGHGSLNFFQSMTASCNPVYVQMGQRLGAERFYSYVQAFGLTEKTGIDLYGEANSIVYKANQMGPVELGSCAFGQSNKITPLQMLTANCAAINGGKLMKPHLVSKILDSDGNVYETIDPTEVRTVISKETSQTLCDMLEADVAAPGSNCYIAGYRIGGKSGTAEKLDSTNPDARVSSFFAFAPANDPQIAVLIFVDEPNSYSQYGSVLAAPAVRAFLAEALPYIGVQPVYTEEELAKTTISVPNLVGKTEAQTKATVNTKGLKVKFVGTGDTVVKTVPAAGNKIPQGGTLIIYLDDSATQTVAMPKLTGLTPAQASAAAGALGINIHMTGDSTTKTAQAVSQSIAAGTQVSVGTVVSVVFQANIARE